LIRAAPRIAGNVVWSGAVELEGECVVAEGSVLRLAPGCRVAAPAGSPQPRLIVEGMLVVEGSFWRPVTLNAAIASAGGWVILSRCRMSGRGGVALNLYGQGHRLDCVDIEGFESAVILRDGAAAARRLTISGCPKAIVVASGGSLSLERARLSGCETGLRLQGGAAVARGLTIDGGAAPVIVGVDGKLDWEGGGVSARGPAWPSIVTAGEFVARGAPGQEMTLDASISAAGGRVDLHRCRLNGRGEGEGLNLYGAGHRFQRVRLRGFATGLILRDGDAGVRELSIDGVDSPLAIGAGGSLRARDMRISGERASLSISEGGRLIWAGGAISASGPAPARVTVKGELTASGGPQRELRLDAVLSLEGGNARLSSFLLISADGEELALEALTIAGCGAGTAAARAGRLIWSGAGAPAGRTVISVKGEFVARGANPFTLDASIAAEGGRVELANCRLEGIDGEGLTLRGTGHLLERVELDGFERGLSVRDGAARARGLTITGERAGLEIGEGGILSWEGGGISASGPEPARVTVKGELSAGGGPERELRLEAALSLEGGSLRLSNFLLIGADREELALEVVTISGCGAGIAAARGGRLTWAGAGAPAGRAVLSVKGEFTARGAGSPFILDASISAEGGRVELANCRLVGRDGEGLTLRGGGHSLEEVTLEGFERALSVRGGETRARGLRIAGERAELEIGEDGVLSWEGGGISASGPAPARVVVKGGLTASGSPMRKLRLAAALSLEGGSARLSSFILSDQRGEELALEALTIADCGAGQVAARRGHLTWVGAGAPAGRAVISVKGEFTARGAGSPFILDASIAAEGGRVELANCRLEGRDGEGLTLRGDGHRLEELTLEGFRCGLSLRGGEARARRFTVVRCETAVAVGEDGRLSWEGGEARSGGTGALVSGGHALLRGLRFQGLRLGSRVENGTLELDGVACGEISGAAVELISGGFAGLRGVLAPGGTVLAAAAGHAHLSGGCEGAVRASASAQVCVVPAALALETLGALRAFVLRTGGRPPWRGAYMAAAASSVRVFASWARLQPRVVGAWVHRSWVAGGWEPGSSDIDLALSVQELSSPRAKSWLARAQSLHAGARRLFPALGELLIAEESEWRETAASGLPRPAEWRRQARVLAGRLPESAAAAPASALLGARLEAAMAYSRLMDVCFHPRMAEELARRETAKAVVDLLRYRSDAGERGAARPREEFRAALASSHPEWAERLRVLDTPGRAHRAACALAAAAARHWAGPELARSPSPRANGAEPPRDSPELLLAREALDGARRDFGGAVSAGVFDTLHRSYLVVEPDSSETILAEGLAAWSRRAAACGLRPALPIVLTPRGWALWRGTAYQDFPSAAARWPRPGGPLLERAGSDFPGATRVFWGDFSSPPPPAEDAAASLAQGRAQFRLIRRLLVREARGSRAAAHHLLSRAACLALASRGLPAPDFDLDAAFSGLESFAPRAAAGLRRAASGDWSEFDGATDELLPPTA
jgi:hypothetical protein